MEKFGFAVGSAGCRAGNRGSTAVGHTEECRKRTMEELEGAGDERVERERETERFYEYLEEEENKRKKAKTEETIGGSNQAAASSSGGGGAGGSKKSRMSAFGDHEQEKGR